MTAVKYTNSWKFKIISEFVTHEASSSMFVRTGSHSRIVGRKVHCQT